VSFNREYDELKYFFGIKTIIKDTKCVIFYGFMGGLQMDDSRLKAMNVAMGQEKADVVISGGKLVNVHTREILEADIAISGKYIAYVGDVQHTVGPDTRTMDASDRYITPGLIETHHHVGGTHLSMTEFAKVVIPHGTVGIVTDFYEMGIVAGKEGVRFCLDELKRSGLEVIFGIPIVAHVQNDPFNNLRTVSLDDLKEMLAWPDCHGYNELVISAVAQKDPIILELTNLTREMGKIIVGHGADIQKKELQAGLIGIGHTSEHEAMSAEKAAEMARLGMHILIREGSAASDLTRAVKAITKMGLDSRMFAFSTDEDTAPRLMKFGHVDLKIRMAIKEGLQPITAIQMATLNAAEASGVANKLGSLVPGKLASLLIVEDLENFSVRQVMLNGRFVARDGQMIVSIEPNKCPDNLMNTVRVGVPITAEHFNIKPSKGGNGATVRVIGVQPGVLFSKELFEKLPVVRGQIPPQPEKDILKIAVIDRHKGTRKMAVGFINGFQLKAGAFGSVYNPCVEDMVILGTNETDMAVVAQKLIEIQGGFVVVKDGEVKAVMETPLFGILSIDPLESMIRKSKRVDEAIQILGCPLQAPFHTLAFMAFPGHFGILKMCNEGLANVSEGRIVNVVVD
jgi:adenine deaminase